MTLLIKNVLVNKNNKLGKKIWAFNLPARKTCLYVSAVCSKVCYACRGHFNQTNVKVSHKQNFRIAKSAGFVRRVTAQIAKKQISKVRLHSSGDFFSPEYVAAWYEIASKNPNVLFWTYTKTWMIPKMQKPLLRLASLPNFQMWFSTDQSMPQPPRTHNVKTAYLSINDKDYPSYPVDLIFRHRPKTVRRRMGAARSKVCPTEDNVVRKNKATCSTCGLCMPKGQTNGENTKAAAGSCESASSRPYCLV